MGTAQRLKHLKPGAARLEAGLVPAAANMASTCLAGHCGQGPESTLERNLPTTTPLPACPARTCRLTRLSDLLDLLDALGLQDLSDLSTLPEHTQRLTVAAAGRSGAQPTPPHRYDPAAMPPGRVRSGRSQA